MLGPLYAYLVVVGVVALALVVAAQLRAPTDQVAGRLWATTFTLGGLIVAASGRVVASLPAVAVGVIGVNIGVTLYVLYLPDKGLLQVLTRRRKDPGGGR